MLRFDYKKKENHYYDITVVSEKDNNHSLVGKLILSEEEFERFSSILFFGDSPDNFEDWKKPFFIFEEKK